jgi:hypothetical protein
MKEIKIGQTDYKLLESVNEINDKRFVFFKMYLLQSLEGIDRPLFKATMERAMDHFNRQRWVQAWGEFENYHHSIEYESYNDDALSKCFALICLEDGDDQLNLDDNYLSDKVERMRKEGLTRGFVEESVENFSKASPRSLGNYSLMLEEVIANFDQTFFEELEDYQNVLKKKKVSKD